MRWRVGGGAHPPPESSAAASNPDADLTATPPEDPTLWTYYVDTVALEIACDL